MSEQQPPRDLAAERAVLGAILINNDAFWRVTPLLDVEDFSSYAHQLLFRTVATQLRRGESADLLTIKSALTQPQIEAVGGSANVSSLVDDIPDIANVEKYAKIVATESKRRRIILSCNSGMRRAQAREESPEEITSSLMSDLTRVAVADDARARPLFDVVTEVFAQKDKLAATGHSDGITTGFPALDAKAVVRPTLIVVGARRGHGKSCLLMNLCDGIVDHGGACAFFSLEATEEEIAPRFVAMRSGVPLRDIRQWRFLNDMQRDNVNAAKKTLEGRPLMISRRHRTTDAMYAECRRLKAQTGLTAVFIDYIQLINDRRTRENKEQQMANVAADLLEMAIDLGIAVVAASQVNKESRTRENGRLLTEDLKYASAIGDSARVVMLFQRPREDDKANTDLPECLVRPFQLEKNNEGQTGDLPMHFFPTTQRFAEGDCVANHCRGLVAAHQRFAAQ